MRVSSKSSGSGNAPAVGGARPAASPSAPVGAAGGPSQVGDALSVSSTAQIAAGPATEAACPVRINTPEPSVPAVPSMTTCNKFNCLLSVLF